ncbi:hypothetical protein F7R14_27855 [Pseudomonas lini]|uniref:Uncharacterized protein n=1 Tax=Pseudomonas lini TaxID=163011 RepID=A0A7V7NZH1_9PSED|nr:hypothetical protein F7R14_27855 [Pseudomonas lini]
MGRVPMIVPTLCVGMPPRTLRVRFGWDAERPWLSSHAERGNDQGKAYFFRSSAPCNGSSPSSRSLSWLTCSSSNMRQVLSS